jgi:hypothetical protein
MAEKFRITYATLSADNEDLQRNYDEAVRLAMDLRAAAAQAGKSEEFDRRIAEVKQRHGRRRGFLDRLRHAETAPIDTAAQRGAEVVP